MGRGGPGWTTLSMAVTPLSSLLTRSKTAGRGLTPAVRLGIVGVLGHAGIVQW